MLEGSVRECSTAQLLGVAREALTAAAGRPAAGPDVYWTLAALRQVLGALDGALDGIARDLVARGESGALCVVDGPFTGEPAAATRTAELWLHRARAMLAEGPIPAVDNAHIATAGLALPTETASGRLRRARSRTAAGSRRARGRRG